MEIILFSRLLRRGNRLAVPDFCFPGILPRAAKVKTVLTEIVGLWYVHDIRTTSRRKMSDRLRGLVSLGIAVTCFTVPAFAGIPAIPEPSTMVLVGLGAVGIIAVRQFRARSKKQ